MTTSISAMAVTGVVATPSSAAFTKPKMLPSPLWRVGGGRSREGEMLATVECSSRPQKKATAHHMKTRPKKTQPWDVRRKGPTHYPPLPTLPPDWTLLANSSAAPPPQEKQELASAGASAPAL